jgi:ankyrin repeat protein
MTPDKARDRLAQRKIQFTVEALRKAIQNSETETVKLFLVAGMSPNELPYSQPNRPVPEDNLRLAIDTGNKELIALLVDRGADINRRNQMEETPLFETLGRNDPEIIRLVVEKGADLTAVSSYGQTVAITAIHMGRLEALKIFLSKGVYVNFEDATGKNLVFHAAGSPNPAVMRLLLEMGGEKNRADRDGVTPLIQAVIGEQLENVRIILEKGADVHVRDQRGRSPLMIASSRNRLDFMQALLDRGAPADMDALVAAAEKGHAEAVRLLLARNGDSLVPFAGEAMMRAAANGNASVVATLLEFGVPASINDARGETPLIKAAQGGHDGTVKILQEKGGDTTPIPEPNRFDPNVQRRHSLRPLVRKYRSSAE